MRRILTALASFFTVLLLTLTPSLAASEAGTHAWSSRALVLRDGPGTAYAVTGGLPAELAIKVLRCQKLWCLVDGDGGRGWTDKQGVVFGLTPTPWPGGIHPNYTTGGEICFYQGTNYTGGEFCVRSGRVIDDLALIGLDNSFASVKIGGTASAAVCRDRGFKSYCERIIASQPVLTPYLRKALSSIRAY